MPSKSKSKHKLETRILAVRPEELVTWTSLEYQLRIVAEDGTVCFSDVVCCDLAHVLGLLLGVQAHHPVSFPIHVDEVVPELQLAESRLAIDHELIFQQQKFTVLSPTLVRLFAFSYAEPVTFAQFDLDLEDVVQELSALVRAILTDKNFPLLVKPERPDPPESAQPRILKPHFSEIEISEPSLKENGLAQFSLTFTGEEESFHLPLILPLQVWLGARSSIAYAETKQREELQYLFFNEASLHAIPQPVAFFKSEDKFVLVGPVARKKDAIVEMCVYTVHGDQATLDYYRVPILAVNRALAAIERKLSGPVNV